MELVSQFVAPVFPSSVFHDAVTMFPAPIDVFYMDSNATATDIADLDGYLRLPGFAPDDVIIKAENPAGGGGGAGQGQGQGEQGQGQGGADDDDDADTNSNSDLYGDDLDVPEIGGADGDVAPGDPAGDGPADGVGDDAGDADDDDGVDEDGAVAGD